MNVATMETVKSVFDVVWPCALLIAVASGIFLDRPRLARCAGALAAGSLAMAIYQQFAPFLPWYGMLAIDIPIFGLVTAPPRYRVQAWLAGLILVQIVLHIVWGMAEGVHGAGRMHWMPSTLTGFLEAAVLLFWSGGPRVEALVDHIGCSLIGMVHRKTSRAIG